jgi:hypothetical protein
MKIVHDVSHPEYTKAHYVTHRSHRIQKHRFGVACPNVLLWDLHRANPDIKNSASTFHALDAVERTT